MSGDEVITKPFKFEGDTLEINFSSSAAGKIQVEILDSHKKVVLEYAIDKYYEIFGDSVNRQVKWKGNSDVTKLNGRIIYLRFYIEGCGSICF